ncbi:MAG: branched-chain amino acid ABC transporter ATP-binding protein [Deltaproteobacteria bacterium HGW-Deltaproteobacteria-15]|jgi:branched-chain amino acid transport system ATP-binding protein|nr:MAG: branched-chain amino acid ABC transporter ATP-binding protein [Deltaproteobacteria bacterium HGW-Deltaproteobacteria-15]
MLHVKNIRTFYGKIQALWDVSLDVGEGEIVTIVGANGAGKTTLLNAISGIVLPLSGRIEFLGKRIDGQAVASIVEMGISHVPQGGRLFPEMLVLENLEMGAYPARAWRRKKETIEQCYQIFPRLQERGSQVASTLSGGEKQMVAIGRGLMARPRLCILDEPSYGLAPKAVQEIFKVIKTLREHGITVLLVEQNVRQALEMADRAYVMENGRIVLEGKSHDLIENDHVRKAYLGL